MQVVLVYLQPFRRNLLLECALQPEIAKKITKNPFWGVQGRSRLSMLINLKSLSPACLFLSATVFTLHEIIAVKYPLFRGVAAVFDARLRRPPWTYGVGTWTAKIYVACWKFYTQVVLVYLQPFRHSSVLKCALHPKIAKNLSLRGSRSFKVIDIDKSK